MSLSSLTAPKCPRCAEPVQVWESTQGTRLLCRSCGAVLSLPAGPTHLGGGGFAGTSPTPVVMRVELHVVQSPAPHSQLPLAVTVTPPPPASAAPAGPPPNAERSILQWYLALEIAAVLLLMVLTTVWIYRGLKRDLWIREVGLLVYVHEFLDRLWPWLGGEFVVGALITAAIVWKYRHLAYSPGAQGPAKPAG